MSQFLVMRDGGGKLRSILLFEDADIEGATKAYDAAEARGVECVLGADRLSTVIRTHSSWFDEAPCMCVCHVGVDGLWRAHACDCEGCPSGLRSSASAPKRSSERSTDTPASAPLGEDPR